jgi:hypothetical protein
MKEYDELYAFSNRDENEEYGLYLLKIECSLHTEKTSLIYSFDADTFINIDKKEASSFVMPSLLSSCKDEFKHEYVGTQLKQRMFDAIRAYEEEFPGYLAYINDTDEKFDRAEK